MFRMATFAASPFFFTSLDSSLRRSSVRIGKIRRMTLPSLFGLMPMSDFWIAFSMGFSRDLSQGWIMMVRGSGAEMFPTCWIGVADP